MYALKSELAAKKGIHEAGVEKAADWPENVGFMTVWYNPGRGVQPAPPQHSYTKRHRIESFVSPPLTGRLSRLEPERCKLLAVTHAPLPAAISARARRHARSLRDDEVRGALRVSHLRPHEIQPRADQQRVLAEERECVDSADEDGAIMLLLVVDSDSLQTRRLHYLHRRYIAAGRHVWYRRARCRACRDGAAPNRTQ